MEGSEKIRSLINEALQKFGLSAAEYELVRHNENITCKVTNGDKAYSLRIHSPVEGYNTDLLCRNYSSREYMQGEVDLLIYMRDHGFPELQEPIAGSDGHFIQTMSDGSSAMLLSWLEGRTLTKEEGPRYAAEIGKMAAKIHQASKGFEGIRIHYDREMTDRLIEEIRTAAKSDHLTQTAADICIHTYNIPFIVTEKKNLL